MASENTESTRSSQGIGVTLPNIAIEVKRSIAPNLSKGFAIACDDLRIEERYLVYTGDENFPIRHGTQVIGLAELMERVGGGTSA